MSNKKLILEIGKKFGKWTVISNQTLKINNITNWKCCCECGKEQYVPLNNLMNGSSTQCKNCAIKEGGLKRRKGYGQISGDYWAQIKSRAKRKKLPFEIRIELAWKQFLEQKGFCAISNKPIVLTGYPYNKEKTTAVLSLTEPAIGFVNYNIIWVHKEIEKIKGSLSVKELISLCHQISEYNK